MPERVLILETENERVYYDVSSEELLKSTMLIVLGERINSNYYMTPTPPEGNPRYEFIKEKLRKLERVFHNAGEEEAFEDIHERMEFYRRDIRAMERSYKKRKAEWDRVHKAVTEQDGELVLQLFEEEQGRYGRGYQVVDVHLADT